MTELFVVASGDYEQYSVSAVFSTRQKAEAWAAARNAQMVINAGVPGLSCQTKEDAAKTYTVEDYTLDLDPEPRSLRTPEEELAYWEGVRASGWTKF